MFGFKRFTSTLKYSITNIILLLSITANSMIFYSEMCEKTVFGVWFILVQLIIILSVSISKLDKYTKMCVG